MSNEPKVKDFIKKWIASLDGPPKADACVASGL